MKVFLQAVHHFIRKALCLFLLLCISTSFAHYPRALSQHNNYKNAANIRIHISGAPENNRYFLCVCNIGCLSIIAAERGKVYPIFRTIHMHSLYVTDVKTRRVYNQGVPPSCNVTVNPGQTISIHGRIISSHNKLMVSGLSCSVQ